MWSVCHGDDIWQLSLPSSDIRRQVSPAGRRRIGQHMTALATYLGHVNIYSTYWYLQAAPDLLQDIADVGETFMGGGA